MSIYLYVSTVCICIIFIIINFYTNINMSSTCTFTYLHSLHYYPIHKLTLTPLPFPPSLSPLPSPSSPSLYAHPYSLILAISECPQFSTMMSDVITNSVRHMITQVRNITCCNVNIDRIEFKLSYCYNHQLFIA